ncbi:hypothetical protein BU17DRAFT_101751 [Hysterangium stoloniferum]|nr:hypothetical protein BU17DRAFT_101751 [Hysterangium stoloniferum]
MAADIPENPREGKKGSRKGKGSLLPQLPINVDHTFSRLPLPLNVIISLRNRILHPVLKRQKISPVNIRGVVHAATTYAVATDPARCNVPRRTSSISYLESKHWVSDFSTRFVEIDIVAYFEGKILDLARLGGWESRKTSSVMEPINNCEEHNKRGDIEHGWEGNELKVEEAELYWELTSRPGRDEHVPINKKALDSWVQQLCRGFVTGLEPPQGLLDALGIEKGMSDIERYPTSSWLKPVIRH